MKKLTLDQIQNQTLIDLRSQKDFQKGHLKGALNLNPKNLSKYGETFLEKEQAIVLVVGEKDSNDTLALVAEAGVESVMGYLIAEEQAEEDLESVDTIKVEDFMELEEDYLLLDLRHPDEITRPSPEKNLINIPLENLAETYQQLNSSKPVYTLCGSGNRATAAASFLAKKGYQTVVIEGGMGAVEAFRSKD